MWKRVHIASWFIEGSASIENLLSAAVNCKMIDTHLTRERNGLPQFCLPFRTRSCTVQRSELAKFGPARRAGFAMRPSLP
jgi:hypothetical protein